MWQFNEDLLYLTFEELKNDKKSLYSCLLVNRICCITAVPILWRNPSQTSLSKNSLDKLFNVILLHLSEESRDTLKYRGMNNLIAETYHRPLFNYISFWKYLEFNFLERMISSKIIEKSNVHVMRNEILKLFINNNTKFIHLSIRQNFDYQLLHLTLEAECCFSELESFQSYDNIDQNILERLTRICKSIKKVKLFISTYNYGFIKLIEIQKNLNDFRLIHTSSFGNESFYKSLEESLIKHADTVQYLSIGWNPTTRFLSYFVNLLYLEITKHYFINWNDPTWDDPNYLKNLSLPILKILKVYRSPLNAIVNLINNTTENLSEISIHCNKNIDSDSCKILIQAIYQNCPNIRYLKLSLNSYLLISEFENLLINCHHLNGLIINISKDFKFNWNMLFQILTKSSTVSLFKFKFFSMIFKLEDIKLFLENWKNRKPILLKINQYISEPDPELVNLIEQYKAKGVIKNCFFDPGEITYEDFEWI
ncbi:hypothetical protein RclHR1_06210011 [Rhizophagus clarus]|uniref:F-box domain-containing protein n=1 Tax=Rhizophagus clarus TaxID=94130 RepID=A0A2Z6RR99_9GLOM|nr:hypothetical protein RclHR1_06210011 [Rhizophagus clarus]GES99157.1 hypothetical protein GLOIN_2v813753 [Rhizophagus clarus]